MISSHLFAAYSQGVILPCSAAKGVYNPKAFFPHAASLGQGFPHCPIFSAAASRRSGARVSVPLAAATLSGHLPVIGLVGHYPTNYLIGRGPFPERSGFLPSLYCLGISPKQAIGD